MKERQWFEERMEKLWHPRRVAMIGATNSPFKWGFIIFARMLHEGFGGEVFPVNPREEFILGRKVFRRISEVPGEIDLAIIVTPANTVPDVLKECAERRVPAVIVITSGFSETGPEGRRLEEEIVRLANSAGMLLVGPNTMGIYSAAVSLNCLMAPISPLPGRTGCIAQSGNVGTHMLFAGRMRGLGVRKFVSSGNEGQLTFEDYLWHLGRDPEISAIVGYVEGLEPASDFLEIAPAISRQKPVILYKGGRTAPGARAAASHTGALAGQTEIFLRAMKQAGVLMADTNKQVVELARALELQPPPAGRRMGILTRGGGWGVITTDACVETGLEIAPLSEATIERLDKILPPYWSRGNPVDMVAVISNQAYLDCLETLLADPKVDGVIALGANSLGHVTTTLGAMRKLGVLSPEEIAQQEAAAEEENKAFARALKEMLRQSLKPVLTVGRWVESEEWENGIMMMAEPEEAAALMAKMVEYGKYLAAPLEEGRG